MRAVPIREKLVKLDDDDHHLVGNYKWCLNKGKENIGYYVVRGERRGGKLQRIYLHRVIAQAYKGDKVTFINNDTLDMRKKNMRKNGRRIK